MPQTPIEGSPPSSRTKLVAVAVAGLALGSAQGCLGLSGTGPDPVDAGGTEFPSPDAGAKYDADAAAGDARPNDAARPGDSTAADTGSPENEDDSSSPTPDTGVPPPPDASQVASDAGQEAGGPFASLVQLAITFDANTVSTTATGGITLTSMDGASMSTDGNDFATQAKVTALGGTVGLPDDGVFPGNGTTIPPLQFGWTNTANNENALFVTSNSPTVNAFPVPPGPGLGSFHHLQIYASGTNGAQTVNYTLSYTTGAATVATVAVADWCETTPLPTGTSKLLSAARIRSTGATLSDSDGFLCSIYAVNIAVDSSRVLSEFSFTDVGMVNSYLVLYGIAAW